MATSTSEASAVSNSHHALSASYRSSNNVDFSKIHEIPAPRPGNATDKIAYLANLRAAVVAMQDYVNAELTARMDEDKALDANSKSGEGKTEGLDDVKEEDNYGEEVPEED